MEIDRTLATRRPLLQAPNPVSGPCAEGRTLRCAIELQQVVAGMARGFLAALLVASIGSALWLDASPVAAQSSTQDAATPETTPTGFYHTVRRGESWGLIANRYDLTVEELQAANPSLVRYGDILRIDDEVLIPGKVVAEATPAASATPQAQEEEAASEQQEYQEYVVEPGDGWSMIAEKFDVRLRDLYAANPNLIRYRDILRVGDVMVIPRAVTAAPATAASATESATVTPSKPSATEPSATETPVTETPTPADTATEPAPTAATATPAPASATTEDAAAEPAPAAGATETAADSTAAPACPTNFADYPEVLLAVLNTPDQAAESSAASMRAFLESCGSLMEDGVQVGDWTGDGAPDLLVLYVDPATTAAATPQTELMIFNSAGAGYVEGYRARAAGQVTLFALSDINSDAQPDIAWIDRTCGASTCFDTAEVVSWDGSQWRDWTQDVITMAYAEIQLADTTPVGQGQEIVLAGGVYGSVGAGPSRGRTEIWGSVDGGPYQLLDRINDESNCLYHTVIDANLALLRGAVDGFARAEELYTKAATDQTLEKCWTRENELDELRSFSLFRLALTAAYEGRPAVATDLIGSLATTYGGSIYDQVGQTWLEVYAQDNDVGAACRAANEFAADNPAAYEILADYGYANPTFTAADVCPLLDVAGEVAPAAATATTTTTTGITATAELTAGAASPSRTAATAADVELPACPDDLSGYPAALPEVLSAAAADPLVIELWLRSCDAMSDARGGFMLTDTNGDGDQDAIFWPTVVSELGFGPDGAQGDLLLFHGDGAGNYELAIDADIYGQPSLLAVDDLNGNGQTDLAWQVVGCSTFCVAEVQIVSWNGEEYASIIEPGATIAEGYASFAGVTPGDPGSGKQLVLTGGVSGTNEGGLAVPHTEVWQSVAGGAFQRIRWTYDRTVEGNDCMGLRLVEADVALQAAPVLGYQPAVDLYSASIDPTLKGCSIFGLKPEEELVLLQGLASFRLLEAEALNGSLENARSTLAGLSSGQPESDFTKAAQEWLDAYEQTADAGAACTAVLPIFTGNDALWQITDHYGFNHPALAAEQLCYAP